MSIFPYVYFMIQDFFRDDPSKQSSTSIAVYAGMVTSAFAFAEFSSGVPWGRLSDKVGRKPVLLTGLAGTALSMLIFGFAPNLPVALLARALGGLLNGYVSSFFLGEFLPSASSSRAWHAATGRDGPCKGNRQEGKIKRNQADLGVPIVQEHRSAADHRCRDGHS